MDLRPGLASATVALALAVVLDAPDASACGGCFGPPAENTQVTSHRMVLSVRPNATTLWDQITYAGAPDSFAWVLPTKGVVDIGLSSDLLFQTLDQSTQVQVFPPTQNCPSSCRTAAVAEDAFGGTASPDASPHVEVLAQEVVGPYETVQLASSDPKALKTWLSDHGYELPADVAPIVDAYVADGFNFLALKLVPGKNVDAMKPVRVTTPGASGTLPLRMVAAGTGAVTPITLWVLGDGRYAPSNFEWFTIPGDWLVWNWATSASNYKELRQGGFDAAAGKTWLIEAAEPFSRWAIEGAISSLIDYDPVGSGYGDGAGNGAYDDYQADLEALFGAGDGGWVTRMLAELPRAALASDLFVGASLDQTPVERTFYLTRTVGSAPACPPDPCGGGSTHPSSTAPGTTGPGLPGLPDLLTPYEPSHKGSRDGGGCALGGEGSLPGATVALGLLMILARRRRGAGSVRPRLAGGPRRR